MTVPILLSLLFATVHGLDFRSNNYRQVFNNALPSVVPPVIPAVGSPLAPSQTVAINPYTDIFVKNAAPVNFPMASLAVSPAQQESTWVPVSSPTVPVSYASYQSPVTSTTVTTKAPTTTRLTKTTKRPRKPCGPRPNHR
uniref:Uncharacterized protein n=1 Tax=Caenorhabditis japonica TaxID=281687 RepID=A0A8R1IDA0_CAEJA